MATVLDEGAVLLDLETKYFYLLNPSGWAITQMFESGATVSKVKDTCEGWGASVADLADVDALISKMLDDSLIVPSNNAPTSDVAWEGPWIQPTIEKQPEPLQRVMVSAFDPSIPLAE